MKKCKADMYLYAIATTIVLNGCKEYIRENYGPFPSSKKAFTTISVAISLMMFLLGILMLPAGIVVSSKVLTIIGGLSLGLGLVCSIIGLYITNRTPKITNTSEE